MIRLTLTLTTCISLSLAMAGCGSPSRAATPTVAGTPTGLSASSNAATGPVLLAPQNGALQYRTTPSFTWERVDGADRYEVQIADDAEFSQLIDTDTVSVPHYVAAEALPTGMLYWRVRGVMPDGTSGWYSEPATLTLHQPQAVYSIPDGAGIEEVERVIAEAAANTPAVVRFAPGGSYRLAPTQKDLIKLDSVSNLIVEGQGATVTFTDATAGLARLNDCTSILVRDLTVRFDPLPYTVGVVRSVESTTGEFTVAMDTPQMVPFDEEPIVNHWTWGVLLDPDVPGKMLDGSPLVISTVEGEVTSSTSAEGETLYTLRLKSPAQAEYFVPGVKYIQFARTGGRSLVASTGSTDVTCLNITNYGISGGHYLCTEGSDFKVLGCTSLIPDGQWFGGNADGIHVRSNKLGPWVEGCLFEGVGDDAVALYSKAIFILKQDSPTQLRLGKKFFNLAPGDHLALFNPREGVILADELEVAAVEPVPAGTDGYPEEHYRVTLAAPLAITLNTSSDDPLENDQAFSRSRVNGDFAIRNNTFSCIRRFGTVVRADGGMIEGNVYDRISDIPVVFRNEPDLWYNGLNGSRIRIANNTILDSGFSQSSEGHGQIELIMYKMGRVPADGRGHRDIHIESNTISDWQDLAIRVANADGVAIVDNTIGAEMESFAHPGPHYGILIDNSANVEIRGNVFTDPREFDAEIEVTDNTSEVRVEE